MKSKEFCYGCSACSYVCKHRAISMKRNREGFLYPIINEDNCVSCGLCDKICPENNGNEPVLTYSGRLTDEQSLYKCASGGAFTALAASFISNGGVVYAASDNLREQPMFISISTIGELYKVQGSKYFQIDLTSDIYAQILASLKETNVLFCGTPCQVAAVKKVFHQNIGRLFTIDLICGGVPPYKLVKQYRDYQEKKYKSTIVEHCFRAKDDPNLIGYQSRLKFSNGNMVTFDGMKDEYTRLFSNGLMLRQSCYNCEFSNERRVGDITIGDYWGINRSSKFYTDRGKGVSLIMCNSQKGGSLINKTEEIDLEEVNFEEVKQHNRPLRIKARKRIERLVSLKLMDIFPFKFFMNIVCYRYSIKQFLNR